MDRHGGVMKVTVRIPLSMLPKDSLERINKLAEVAASLYFALHGCKATWGWETVLEGFTVYAYLPSPSGPQRTTIASIHVSKKYAYIHL